MQANEGDCIEMVDIDAEKETGEKEKLEIEDKVLFFDNAETYGFKPVKKLKLFLLNDSSRASFCREVLTPPPDAVIS